MPTKTATFAMGCFWSPDARFGSIPGVLRTRVGYTGGQLPDPSYSKLGDHTETVQLDYDPARLSYEELLQVFWTGHNPAKPVWGPQYMSAIFYQDPEQQELGKNSLEAQSMGGRFRFPTQLLPLGRFYLAEPYHQKHYLRRQTSLLKELSGLFPDDEMLLASTEAARINGSLAGFGEPAMLTTELAALPLPPHVMPRLVAVLQEYKRRGEL